MQRWRVLSLPGLVASLFLFNGFNLAWAQAADNKKKLQEVRSRIQETRQHISAEQGRKTDAQAALKRAEKKISFIGRRLHVIRKDYEIQQQSEQALREAVRQREMLLRQQQQRLAELMRAAFQMERHGQLRMLLNQEDPALFLRMMTYHDYLSRQRVQQIGVVNQHLEALQAAHHALALQTRALARLRDSRQQELARLEQVKARRQQALAAINNSLDQKGRQLAQLRKDESALSKVIKSLVDLLGDIPAGMQQKKFAELKGELNWPSAGRLLTRFGAARGDSGKKWSGVIIGAQRGASVNAIARGRVAFSDWLRGYGLLVIIDHGEGYMSLYGHNESVYKDTGEWVESGEVIASVGDSGGQSRTGLYFEIRHKGKPLNPVHWGAKRKPPAAG